jgi:hypothetical protein
VVQLTALTVTAELAVELLLDLTMVVRAEIMARVAVEAKLTALPALAVLVILQFIIVRLSNGYS